MSAGGPDSLGSGIRDYQKPHRQPILPGKYHARGNQATTGPPRSRHIHRDSGCVEQTRTDGLLTSQKIVLWLVSMMELCQPPPRMPNRAHEVPFIFRIHWLGHNPPYGGSEFDDVTPILENIRSALEKSGDPSLAAVVPRVYAVQVEPGSGDLWVYVCSIPARDFMVRKEKALLTWNKVTQRHSQASIPPGTRSGETESGSFDDGGHGNVRDRHRRDDNSVNLHGKGLSYELAQSWSGGWGKTGRYVKKNVRSTNESTLDRPKAIV